MGVYRASRKVWWQMILTLLRDWGFNKCGETVEVWEPMGAIWIRDGIAKAPELARENRSEGTETAEEVRDGVESAVVSSRRRHPHRR
jgi:hypothetical protein